MDEVFQEGESQEDVSDTLGEQETSARGAMHEQTQETQPLSTAGTASEQSYTDTIQNLLSELWKERLVLHTLAFHWCSSWQPPPSIAP